jgi:hypothetical protein
MPVGVVESLGKTSPTETSTTHNCATVNCSADTSRTGIGCNADAAQCGG